MTKIHGSLREAYLGYYEDDREARDAYRGVFSGDDVRESYESWLERWCEAKIRQDAPKRHLEIYLEWNGILGYTDTIWDLAMGGGVSR